MLGHEPGSLVTSTGVTQQSHLFNTLFFKPVQPGANLVDGIFMLVVMGCFAIVGTMTIIQSQPQIDRQRTHAVLQKQFLQGSHNFALVVRESAMSDQDCRSSRPAICPFQIGIQGQVILLQLHLFSVRLEGR